MTISQKCQYALRSLFELGKRKDEGPTSVAQIARAQAIPRRFLELILGQLRQGGFVESKRGARGGYVLSVRPDRLTVGRVIRFVDGPFNPVACLAGPDKSGCLLRGRCVFAGLWRQAAEAVAGVYDATTFQDLIEAEPSALHQPVDYAI